MDKLDEVLKTVGIQPDRVARIAWNPKRYEGFKEAVKKAATDAPKPKKSVKTEKKSKGKKAVKTTAD